MITKFKIFENKSRIPQVGDYVKFDWRYFSYDFFKTAIGRIVSILINKQSGNSYYSVKFEEKNPMNNSYINSFDIYEFSDWDSDKDALIMKDDMKKYNL